MALTSVSYIGDGSTQLYTITFPFISQSHVVVTLDGISTTAYTYNSSSVINFTTAPNLGAVILIKRTTEQTPIVDFVDGSTLTEALLDTATTQAIYIAQEAYEGVATSSSITDAVSSAAASASTATVKSAEAVVSANLASSKAAEAVISAATAVAAAGTVVPLDTQIHGATAKTTPVDADELPLTDSAASYGLKKVTWGNLKATITAYLSTLYAPKGAVVSSSLTQATAKLLGRTTAATGAIEEISVGAGLTLSAGSLSFSGSTGGMTLLGSVTTTSGATQTLSSLDLSTYRALYIVMKGVSATVGANMRLNSIPFTDTIGLANTCSGFCWVDLVGGTFIAKAVSNALVNEGVPLSTAAGSGGDGYSGKCGYTTVSTSIVFSPSGGNFDAGSIDVYGVK